MATSVTTTSSSSTSQSNSQSQEQSQGQSTTQKVLNNQLLAQILMGLSGRMTDAEISEYAENLLRPTLNAELEASQQNYEATKLSKEQEIENLAANLQRGIEQQEKAYRQSAAAVETAALARGMGRSSYALQTLANQGNALAQAVQNLTTDANRQSGQIQSQISLAARQNAQTQGRANTDYAKNLAAKIQEMRTQQQNAWNSNYLTAVSAAMGSQTNSQSTSQGTSQTHSSSSGHSTSVTTTGGGGRRSSSEDPIRTP